MKRFRLSSATAAIRCVPNGPQAPDMCGVRMRFGAPAQRMILGQRFGISDVERRSSDHAFDQRIRERRLSTIGHARC